MNPRIYVDFQNTDSRGRLRLTCAGTSEDLQREQIEPREGLVLTLYSDDGDGAGGLDNLIVEGTVSYSTDEKCWVAAIDWNAIRHESEIPATSAFANGEVARYQSHTLPVERHG